MELGIFGRERELGRLAALVEGGARVALVVGQAGAGKGALVGALLRRRAADRIVCGRCVAGALPTALFESMGMLPAPVGGGGPSESRRAAQFAHVGGWLDARSPQLVVIERVDLADAALRDLLAWLTLTSTTRFLFTSRDDEPWLGPIERIVLPARDAAPFSDAACLMAAAGALYGRATATTTLARLAGLDDLAAARAAVELERAPVDGAAVLAALDETTRRRLHLAAGRALASDDPVRAADHLLRAGAGEEAVDAALAAGDRLERACAYERAIELYRGAAARTRRAAVATLLDERLCALLRATGDYAGARVHAERLRDRAPKDAAAHRRVAELHLLEDRAVEALAAADGAASLVRGSDERARWAALRAEALYALGRAAEARAISLPADAPVDVVLQLGNTHGKALLAAGEYAAAAAAFAAHADVAHGAARPFDECRAIMNRGIAELRLGNRKGARTLFTAALGVAEAAGDLRNRAFCLQNLGVLAHFGGDYATAIGRFGEARAAFAQLGQRARAAWVALDLASVYVDLDEPARAEAELARAVANDAPAVLAIDRALVAGRIAWRRGDSTVATQRIAEALAAAREAGDRDRAVDAELAMARVLLDAGDADAAARVLDGVGEVGSPSTRARLVLLQGEAAIARGGDDGRALVQEALALAGRSEDVATAARALTLLGRTVAAAELERQMRRPASASGGTRLIGRHASMVELGRLIDKIGRHESTVLVRGESGTGKELVAEALHATSARRGRPLIKVNCGALVETLLESELFGHERGAFTGAVARKKGRFEAADGATLFLDEIGDISPKTQAALLRVLCDGELLRVGGTQPIRVDVRLIAATNRDLEAMVARGEFRQDLYYRLKGIQLELPPLRQRVEDIPLLCDALLERFAAERRAEPRRLAPETLTLLCRHPWPGNVRELENVLRAVSLFADGPLVTPKDLADYTEVWRTADARPRTGAAWQRLDRGKLSLKALKTQIEIECIAEALARAGGNITRAAGILGMKRPRLSQLIKEHGIAPAGERP